MSQKRPTKEPCDLNKSVETTPYVDSHKHTVSVIGIFCSERDHTSPKKICKSKETCMNFFLTHVVTPDVCPHTLHPCCLC